MSTKFRVIDRGWNRIRRQMKLLDNSFTKVGVQEGELRADDLSEMVIVAAANEFGTERIPERSFLRSTVDKKRRQIFALKKTMYNQILDGRKSTRRGLQIIGEDVQFKIQSTIRKLKTPPNAPSTIKRKHGKANPLVDTGNLVQSIRHVEVVR